MFDDDIAWHLLLKLKLVLVDPKHLHLILKCHQWTNHYQRTQNLTQDGKLGGKPLSESETASVQPIRHPSSLWWSAVDIQAPPCVCNAGAHPAKLQTKVKGYISNHHPHHAPYQHNSLLQLHCLQKHKQFGTDHQNQYGTVEECTLWSNFWHLPLMRNDHQKNPKIVQDVSNDFGCFTPSWSFRSNMKTGHSQTYEQTKSLKLALVLVNNSIGVLPVTWFRTQL